MRFIGNKENLLDKIDFILTQRGITGKTFFDFFSGTTSVARFYKKKNYKIYTSDLLYFSYCMQYAYIKNNSQPTFDKLLRQIDIPYSSYTLLESSLDKILLYLNNLKDIEGFIYKNYSPGGTVKLKQPRMYLSDNNSKKIDAIRIQIERWYLEDLLTKSEYYILLTCLIESVSFFSNVSGVYASFQKKWDPRALKTFVIKPIELVFNKQENEVFNKNSISLISNIDVDILYLDPPYNERQYAPNYHLLETIALYDSPEIHGITGLRDYSTQKSSFCNKNSALEELNNIASNSKYKYLVLSYNSEGIMSKNNIVEILSRYGNFELIEFEYLRFKSNNNGESKIKKHVNEQLYILKKY